MSKDLSRWALSISIISILISLATAWVESERWRVQHAPWLSTEAELRNAERAAELMRIAEKAASNWRNVQGRADDKQ